MSKSAMRDALESVDKVYDLLSKPCIVIEEVRQACRKARAVLISTPLRNCDVGTVEEQAKRCFAYCNQHVCEFCPCNTIGRCTLIWAQMPYCESEAK